MSQPLITVQLCTYNRSALIGQVLDALFCQNIDPDSYEIVLVDDGSTDDTYEKIRILHPNCSLHLIRQANAGLAASRNAGIARARADLILFMDDDVIATPGLLEAHLRFHREQHRSSICRGAVINVGSLEALPPAVYSLKHYSGAYFWTTNVSVPMSLLRAAGNFDERFREYGWEDLELGYRLRRMGVASKLARDALVYHYKPPLRPEQFARLANQARAQARTARQFIAKHPHWRIKLATGQVAPVVWWSGIARRAGWPVLLQRISTPSNGSGRLPMGVRRWAARRYARAAYFEELSKREVCS